MGPTFFKCFLLFSKQDDDDDDNNVVQLFERDSEAVDSRLKSPAESAPYVIKNDTDMMLVITYGKYYQVNHLITYLLSDLLPCKAELIWFARLHTDMVYPSENDSILGDQLSLRMLWTDFYQYF